MTSLRQKLWIGFGTLLFILLLVSALTAIVLTRYGHTLERVFRENYDSVTYCDQMKDAADQLNLRAQLLLWNPAASSQIDPASEQSKFDANLDHEFHNLTLPGEAEHTQRVSDLWKQYKTDLDQFDAAAPPSRSQLYTASLLPDFKTIHETLQWISNANISNMVSVDGQVKRTLAQVRTAFLALSIAGTLAAALAVAAAGRSILHPIRNLMLGAKQIESGDLDLHLPVRSHDEIGSLAEAFNSMAAKLREFRRIDHERLLRTQQTTQLAIDSLRDAVFIIGPAGRIEISNRMARIHFGIEPELTVDHLAAKLQWLRPLYESTRSNRQEPQSQGYDSAIPLIENGQERFLLPHAVPMLGVEGVVIGVSVILVDVTFLRLADEAKSDLVSTVSHELRTPLTTIRMAMNLLSDPRFGPLGERQAKLIEAARQDSERLHRIIENLLNISRIESGRAQFQLRPIPVAEIVTGAVDPLRTAFAEKNLKLKVNIAPNLPSVLADPIAIGSALTNLLTNAMKFTPAGGEVAVAAENIGENITITVADTGPGIPEQYAPRIFEKFFRIPMKDGPSGAGLGLSIAKEIAEAHHGRIQYAPGKTGGSEFRLTLPAQTPSILAANR